MLSVASASGPQSAEVEPLDSLAHIRPQLKARKSGRALQVQGFGGPKLEQVGGGRRGEVEGFSRSSRRRLFQTVAAIPWDRYGRTFLVTLTYPGKEAPDYVPTDGRKAKAQLAAFRKRWVRKWGAIQAVWKLEFQGRGAAHWMLLVVPPEGVTPAELEGWCLWVWWEVVGSRSKDHLKHGAQVVEWKGDPSNYFAKYAVKGTSKEYQHQVPEWYARVGRFWGLWGVSPEWEEVDLSPAQFTALRRLVVRYRRARSRNPRRIKSARSRFQGAWLVGGTASGALADRLMRGVWDPGEVASWRRGEGDQAGGREE